MDLAQYWFQQPPATDAAVGNSLRFRGAQYLERTPSVQGDRKIWTWSGWVKFARMDTSSSDYMFSCGSAAGGGLFTGTIRFTGSAMGLYWGTSASFTTSVPVFRDPSAWYHVCLKADGTNIILYHNNVEIARRSATTDGAVNAIAVHRFGRRTDNVGGDTNYFKGYLAENHFVDGQALNATNFGEFNDDGVWVPKRVSGITYGTNGFYLDFSDPDDIGADRSGNGNDWSATGFELANTSSADYDLMTDSPTNNFCTLNPLIKTTSTISNANLKIATPVGISPGYATFNLPTSGKWYWECVPISYGRFGFIGIEDPRNKTTASAYGTQISYYGNNGSKCINGTFSSYGASFDNNDVIGVAVNVDDNEITFYKNNVSQGAITGVTLNEGNYSPSFDDGSSTVGVIHNVNYGQRPFTYDPPTDFEPLSTAEQPEVAITNPSDHFDVITDTGANILTAAQAKFANGLWWIKDRVNANEHQLADSFQNPNATEAIRTPSLSNSDPYVAPTGNSVAWCWGTDANGLNRTAGFEIVTYSGNGTSQDISHQLGKTPEMIFVHNTSNNPVGASRVWIVGHTGLTGNMGQRHMLLNTNGGETADSTQWNNNPPTSTAFTVGSSNSTNNASTNYIAYLWTSVPGYSAFGSYIGNGNVDGPFIYTGFKPAFVLIKTTAIDSWHIYDNRRNVYNPANSPLYSDLTIEERPASTYSIDMLSNGFKLRNNNGGLNLNNQAFIYAAFAEHPFGGSNVSPTTAR
jgi:hypothetical protein